MLGLPSKCQPKIVDGRVYLRSLMAAEHDVLGYAMDTNMTLEKVKYHGDAQPMCKGF